VTLLFHKPFGVTTQFSGEAPNLSNYVEIPGVYAAGRLDKDSEGLLLLTSDGRLQHGRRLRKLSTSKHWSGFEMGLFSAISRHSRPKPLFCETKSPCRPATRPSAFAKSVPTAWIELILTEGKNRAVWNRGSGANSIRGNSWN